MLTPELELLKPIDPSITNSDDYEIYTLSSAQVYHANSGEPASLLDAYADTPLTVEGKLEPPARHQHTNLVKTPYTKAIPIEIKDVTRFSYGQTEDGETVVWALGKAGWHEIRPARSYKHIFYDMIEAIEILYFVTDIHNAPRKRGGGPAAELIFQEYSEDDRFSCESPAAAAKRFYKHVHFLIMCMLNRAQGLGWSNTPLYQHIKKRFPKEWQLVRNRVNGKSEVVKTKTGTKASAVKPQRRNGKVAESQLKSVVAPKKDDNWWEAAAIWEFMQKTVTQGAVHSGHVTLQQVAELMVKRYEIDSEEVATHVILVHASNLRYMMQHPKRRKSLHFLEEPIFKELVEDHQLPATTMRKASQMELRPRKGHLNFRELLSEEEFDGSTSSDVTTPQRRPSNKGKFSALRLKSNRSAGKGKGVKRGKTTYVPSEEEEEDEEEEDEDDNSTEDSPLEVMSPAKRKAPDELVENSRKRAASTTPDADLKSPSSSPSSTEAFSEILPLRRKAAGKSRSPGFLPPIVSTPLPSFTANGPGDSWICTFDGCSYKAYGASKANGKKLMKEHMAEHAESRQKQLDLIMSEEQRLRLPVNNLIKRIREMAEQQQSLFPGAGVASTSSIPIAPIERRV